MNADRTTWVKRGVRAAAAAALMTSGVLPLAHASLRLQVAPCNAPTNMTFTDGARHSLNLGCTFEQGGVYSSGSAVAGGQASTTVMKLGVSTISQGFGRPTAEAEINVADRLWFEVPGFTGSILVTYALSVDASTLSVSYLERGYSMNAHSRWQYIALLGSSQSGRLMLEAGGTAISYQDGGFEHTLWSRVNGQDGDVLGTHYVTAALQANTYVDLRHVVRAFANGGNPYATGTTIANVDMGNSIYWGGILGVTTADGTALDFTVRSTSGVDYLKSYVPVVPEPATYAMLGLGLLIVASRRCRSEL